MERTLKDLSVEGVKTRKKPSKHIVFAVQVTWSDGQVNVVSRRYSEFFELMEKLNEKFPDEAGKHDHNKRILPNLQAKKMFLVSSSVMKQLERITHFTNELVLLPDHISQCYILRTFFTPNQADVNESNRKRSVAKPTTKSRSRRRKSVAEILHISGPMSLEQYRVIADVEDDIGMDVKEGQIVEVIEKLDTGWWLVSADGEQGWVPASYLSNEDNPEETMTTIKYQPGQGECYVTNASYTATFKDELSFDIGVHLQVIEKNLDGWWRAIYNGCEGLVPAAYLKKVGENKFKHKNKPPPLRKKSVFSISRKYSTTPQNDMTVETLTKLRESTFKSPEETEERMLPKTNTSTAGQRKVKFADLGTLEDEEEVPQVMQTAQLETSSSSELRDEVFFHENASPFPKEREMKHLDGSENHVAQANDDDQNEQNTLEDHKDGEHDSSDEDICTLEDLLSEVKEIEENKRRMSTENGSYDSGMEAGPSPPSSPVPMAIPHKSAANNMYVVIADYEGSKEDGEVDLFEGQQVRVLQKTVGGWWLVEDDAEQRGWAPSNFLEYSNPQPEGFNKQQLDTGSDTKF